MLRFVSLIGLILVTVLLASPAKASADSTCYPDWNLYNRDLRCASSAVIAPGNDTRANLLLMLQDGKLRSQSATYPELGWDRTYARNYFNWGLMRKAFYPQVPLKGSDNKYLGTRCVSFPSGSKAFNAAIAANRSVSAGDRKTLTEMREFIKDVCEGKDYWGRPPKDLTEIMSNADSVLGGLKLSSKAANEYVTYLRGASDFYGGEFASAAQSFTSLKSSKDKWLKETAAYMTARVQLNAAQEGSFGKWGDFKGADAVNKSALEKASAEFSSYVKRYPKGRYAASARGLTRRVFWLSNDLDRLAAQYQDLLDRSPGWNVADIAEEIDTKLLLDKGARLKVTQPLLLATVDLMLMRDVSWDDRKPITLAELEEQRGKFANHPELFQFLLANHAFYVQGNAKKVLKLIPDAARQENFSYLQFSRQALRGAALQMLGDRNEGGFWREVLGGTKSLYQRPAAELGLAVFYEQAGQIDKIFEKSSPIKEPAIRKILIQQVAGPKVLRSVVGDSTRPKDETDLALFTLLYNNLSRGNYAAFLRDQENIPANANSDAGLWRLGSQKEIPVGRFGSGAQKGEYDCPTLRQTAQTLSRAPKNNAARLCLGDFWLENGFDYFNTSYWPRYARDDKPKLPALGSTKPQFPGAAMPRQKIYTDIIADPRAKADEKAYALYRAIRCYATSGSNSCGGKAVKQPQRKAWFQRLKRSYPGSKWAKKLKYYW